MASNSASGAADRDRPEKGEGGFFTVYKSGQGYWTRMGTAGGAVLIGVLIAHFFYRWLPAWGVPMNITLGVAAGFAVVYGLFVFWMMNKPSNADFLIATDSEMKKVNWTSRRELIGSTRVVILFMLLLAAVLFVVDIIFGFFFYLIGVLQTPPV
jgi:preprotein translocase subunit SecE